MRYVRFNNTVVWENDRVAVRAERNVDTGRMYLIYRLIVDASRRTSPNIDSRILSNHLCEYINYGLRHGFVVDCDEIFWLRIHLEGSVKAESCFNLLRT